MESVENVEAEKIQAIADETFEVQRSVYIILDIHSIEPTCIVP